MPKSVFTNAYAAMLRVLIAARKERMTQAQLAKRLGKTQPLVSLIEKGERRVDLIEFVAISRAMGVDPRDLFDEIIAVLPDKIDI
jgi:transcriptional regulator with XRE-family HTH domain